MLDPESQPKPTPGTKFFICVTTCARCPMIHVRGFREPYARNGGWHEFKSIGWLCPRCKVFEYRDRKRREMQRYRVKLKGDKRRRQLRKRFKKVFKERFAIELRRAIAESRFKR